MVLDRCENLKNYTALDEGISRVFESESVDIPYTNRFFFDKNHSHLFTINRGSALFATGWRENPESNEINAAIVAKSGDFVLYLPGEPILIKPEEGSEISLYILDV